MSGIILFDGECNFCDKSVQFIIKHDQQGYFKFASRQSDIGHKLLTKYQVPNDIDSLVLIEENHFFVESSAALRICKHLDGFLKIGILFLVIPKPIRNFVYQAIAKNRYKWFGKKDYCTIPKPEIRERFL